MPSIIIAFMPLGSSIKALSDFAVLDGSCGFQFMQLELPLLSKFEFYQTLFILNSQNPSAIGGILKTLEETSFLGSWLECSIY